MAPTRVTLIGAGPLGRATLPHLLERGDEVTLVTRSGTALPGTAPFAEDVTVPGSLDGAPEADVVLVVCNFPYGRWPRDWPPAIAQVLDLAARDTARVVLAGSLYSYARGPRGPMRQDEPLVGTWVNGRLRRIVWEQVLEARATGRIAGAVEVRGSDYVGPATGPNAHGGDRVLLPALEGRTVRPLGDPDLPHAWTATADFGRLLARAVHDPAMEGRAWHVPSAPAVSQRRLVTMALESIGRPDAPRISPVPTALLRLMGVFSPDMRRLAEATYQFTAPWLVDDSPAREELGETHTPLEESLRAAMEHLRQEQRRTGSRREERRPPVTAG